TDLVEVDGRLAQYFEKGRLEDHRSEPVAPDWAFMYGRLAAELIERGSTSRVDGTTLTYMDLKRRGDPTYRHPAPPDFVVGRAANETGRFIPYDPQLRAAPGYIVPTYFWDYITRADLFPSGWLHDVGLPLTDAFQSKAIKDGRSRDIVVQAFERAMLTYDPQNPADWQVERANIGADAVRWLPPQNTIEIPQPTARITLPLHVLARVGRPGDILSVALVWENGAKLMRQSTVRRGEDGRGVLIDSYAIPLTQRSQHPWTQAARVEIRDGREMLLAQQSVVVLHPDDPDTREVNLYWVVGERIQAQPRRIPRMPQIQIAALEALLWGPCENDPADSTTALPTPAEVLAFPSRTAEWGPRVTLRTFSLIDGTAMVDFSPELRAYGGATLRGSQIHAQITRTLLQFTDDVSDVRITIAGENDRALEP
ncbi:MAG TPA: GerMN domain-containing protein, partial [Roseiflexaceae bacterium]|nr:GerMN domain-containing protein [Roseiflexaceae bacterium]